VSNRSKESEDDSGKNMPRTGKKQRKKDQSQQENEEQKEQAPTTETYHQLRPPKTKRQKKEGRKSILYLSITHSRARNQPPFFPF